MDGICLWSLIVRTRKITLALRTRVYLVFLNLSRAICLKQHSKSSLYKCKYVVSFESYVIDVKLKGLSPIRLLRLEPSPLTPQWNRRSILQSVFADLHTPSPSIDSQVCRCVQDVCVRGWGDGGRWWWWRDELESTFLSGCLFVCIYACMCVCIQETVSGVVTCKKRGILLNQNQQIDMIFVPPL